MDIVAVAMPVPVIVTFPFCVSDPVVGGIYCTVIVQLLPGLTTAPDTQEPPVIVIGCVVPPVKPFTIVGFAVSVRGPVAPVALVTVIVPVFVVPLAGVVVNAGVGTGIVTVAAVTVKVTLPVFPIGVVTLTVLAVCAAPDVIVKVALIVVELTTVRAPTVTPVPDTVTVVAPVRLVPVSVTGTLLPIVPEAGAIEVNVAPTTVNVVVAVPPGVVMVTVRADRVAPVVIVKVAVAVVELATVKALTVTPEPDTVSDVAPVRLVPVSVTGTAVPRTPEFGAIEVSVGAGGAFTVKITAPVVPPGVTTVTFLAVSVAVAVIAKFAVTDVSLAAVTPVAVTPVPVTFTAVAPVRPVPVKVTGTVVPRTPEMGAIEVSVGATTVNVTALLIPPEVVTVTFLAESPAVALIVKVAVT